MIDDRHTPGYWEDCSRPYLGTPDLWLAVSDSGSSMAVARQVHRIEHGVRIVAHHLPYGASTIDVGCGYGRWFPLISPGRSLTGMDFAPSLVRAAAANAQGVPVVLQFLPLAERPPAVTAVFASVRPGGTVVLFEKICGGDGSAPGDWIRWGQRAGGWLVRWYGNQFVPLDRWLVASIRILMPRKRARVMAESQAVAGARPLRDQHPALFRLYGFLRGLEFRGSSLLEPLFERILPPRWAEHGIFAFQRE